MFIVLVFLLRLLSARTQISQTNPCSWPEQLEKIKSYIDHEVDPCGDFHQYACGTWHVPYELRAFNARDTLTSMQAANKLLLMHFFEEIDDDLWQLNTTERAAVMFYQSCLDSKLAVKPTRGDLRPYIEALLSISDWPLLTENYVDQIHAYNASFNWPQVSAQLRRYGVQSFWNLQVQPNWQASEQLIFYMTPVRQDLLQQSKSPMITEEQAFLYKRYIKYLLLDLNVRSRQASTIAQAVVDFELQLLELNADSDSHIILHKPQTIVELQREIPEIQLDRYFTVLLSDFADRLRSSYPQKVLVVLDKRYMKRLLTLLRETPTETIAEYLLVQFLSHFEVHLHVGESFYEQKQHCLQLLQQLLPRTLSTLFLKVLHTDKTPEYFQQTTNQLQIIFNHMKLQFEKLLNKSNIFEQEPNARQLSFEKLRDMRLILPELQREETLEKPLPKENNFDDNLLFLAKHSVHEELERWVNALTNNIVVRDVGIDDLPAVVHHGPFDVNAYYSLKDNAIEVPVGMLREPLFGRCLAPPKIYGSFVYTLAHELVHAFDYDGLKYDKEGNSSNGWGAKTIIKFGSISSCYLQPRYQNATLNINENMADSEGLQLALQALNHTKQYRSATETERKEQLRLFFTSFGQNWCGKSLNHTTDLPLLHANHKERVNNALSNLPEFAEAFDCQPNTYMNPTEKCSIWQNE